MQTTAVVLEAPERLSLAQLEIDAPGPADVVVDIRWSGISTGTEKLFYTGKMPPFPGMGYPLVPGYEAFGEVVEAGSESGRRVGDTVFVPGASCYGAVRGLFGGAASRLVTAGRRVAPTPRELGREGALLALAATARHALAGAQATPPDLIVGHGVLGRLLARVTCAIGAPAPTVWEIAPERRTGAEGYPVIDPAEDARRDYRSIYDVSGHGAGLDGLIARLAPGGELVLAGFYSEPLSFAFPPAFLREARLRVAAEWQPHDLDAVAELIGEGRLSLSGLISHTRPAAAAAEAYASAFADPACLKMILDWEGTA